MKNIEPKILKGFRDFLPNEARKRQYVINTLKSVFESYGFEPLETPALEYEEILLGKYGEEGDKLMYRFTDRGKRKVALRYDQTVPLARVVAQYGSAGSLQVLPMPFKRYQIQNVWRADNTQRGRFREFTQCDIDTVGASSLFADAEIIACALKAAGKVFQSNKVFPRIRINDRAIFDSLKLNRKEISAIDKLEKKEHKTHQLLNRGIKLERAQWIVDELSKTKATERVEQVFQFLKGFGFIEGLNYWFDRELARGLDYYTGIIFELELMIQKKNVPTVWTSKLSLGGGGRYDDLIGLFAGKQIPAIGFAFGFDRLIEAMTELKLFPDDLQTTKVLVTVFSKELLSKSIEISSQLRSNNINAEIYLDENAKMEKQLKYADKKGIPYVVIIGSDEVKKNVVTLRDMNTREQKTIPLDEVLSSFLSP